MKTKAEDRKWMKAAAEEHGCMDPQRFCDSFDCTTAHSLISDVEDAVGLLKRFNDETEYAQFCEYSLKPVPDCTRETCLPCQTADFLKEPNKGVDSDKK